MTQIKRDLYLNHLVAKMHNGILYMGVIPFLLDEQSLNA